MRLHRQLREEGYRVGETLVRAYLREWRRWRAEVYVPLVHRPGDEAQVDFFEVTVEVGGEHRKPWKFLMRFMYSGGRGSFEIASRSGIRPTISRTA